jgi:MoxR-like ATPase
VVGFRLAVGAAAAATERRAQARGRSRRPAGRRSKGSVLLIDEIDKAEADLPNGLLETLGNGGFSVPWLDAAVCAPPGTCRRHWS